MERTDTIRTHIDFTLRTGERARRGAGCEELPSLLPRRKCCRADKY